MTNTKNLNLLKEIAVATLVESNNTDINLADGCGLLNRTEVNCSDFLRYIADKNQTAELVINYIRNAISHLDINATNITDAATLTFFNNATFEGLVLARVNAAESALTEKYSGENNAYCDPIKGSRTPDFIEAQDLFNAYICTEKVYASLCDHTNTTSTLLGQVEDTVVCS